VLKIIITFDSLFARVSMIIAKNEQTLSRMPKHSKRLTGHSAIMPYLIFVWKATGLVYSVDRLTCQEGFNASLGAVHDPLAALFGRPGHVGSDHAVRSG
jgi:hypothetical protein